MSWSWTPKKTVHDIVGDRMEDWGKFRTKFVQLVRKRLRMRLDRSFSRASGLQASLNDCRDFLEEAGYKSTEGADEERKKIWQLQQSLDTFELRIFKAIVIFWNFDSVTLRAFLFGAGVFSSSSWRRRGFFSVTGEMVGLLLMCRRAVL